MKKTVSAFLISALFLTACHKSQINPPVLVEPFIVGKWNVDTLTTYFTGSNGLLLKRDHAYPVGAPDYPYSFEFKNDHSVIESMHLPTDANYIVVDGAYSFTSDSSFTRTYVSPVSGVNVEACKILFLSNSSLVFSRELITIFNGNDPGTIRYVYKLTRQ